MIVLSVPLKMIFFPIYQRRFLCALRITGSAGFRSPSHSRSFFTSLLPPSKVIPPAGICSDVHEPLFHLKWCHEIYVAKYNLGWIAALPCIVDVAHGEAN